MGGDAVVLRDRKPWWVSLTVHCWLQVHQSGFGTASPEWTVDPSVSRRCRGRGCRSVRHWQPLTSYGRAKVLPQSERGSMSRVQQSNCLSAGFRDGRDSHLGAGKLSQAQPVGRVSTHPQLTPSPLEPCPHRRSVLSSVYAFAATVTFGWKRRCVYTFWVPESCVFSTLVLQSQELCVA